MQHPQSRFGGHKLTTQTLKTLILAQKVAFLGYFSVNKGVFLVVAALKHLSNQFNGMQHMVV